MGDLTISRRGWSVAVACPDRWQPALERALSPHFRCERLRDVGDGSPGPDVESAPPTMKIWAGCTPKNEPEETWAWRTPHWSVLLYPGQGLAVPDGSLTEAARMVRELYRAQGCSQGRLLQVHGAAASSDHGAVLILGNKRAGKTTTLLTLLGQGLAYVANDDAMLARHEEGLAVEGSARRLNVRAGSEQLVSGWPALTERLTSHSRYLPDGDHVLTTDDLNALGVTVRESARLLAVIYPRLSPHELRWTPVSDAARRRRLLRSHCLVPPSRLNAFLMGFIGEWDVETSVGLLRDVTSVPVYELHGSLASAKAVDQLRRLLDEAGVS